MSVLVNMLLQDGRQRGAPPAPVPTNRTLLFNLASDPQERQDLASQQPARLAQMQVLYFCSDPLRLAQVFYMSAASCRVVGHRSTCLRVLPANSFLVSARVQARLEELAGGLVKADNPDTVVAGHPALHAGEWRTGWCSLPE